VTSDLELAHLLANAADAIAMTWYSPRGVITETKADGSPVTPADREIEAAIKALLAEHRPGDSVLGEEVGASGSTHRRWILDGIDGTHNFAAGHTEWGTHIALEDHGEIVAGVVTSPALGRRWWAERDGGSWTAPMIGESRGEAERLHCSDVSRLAAATAATIPSAGVCTGWRHELASRVERGGVFPTAFGHSAMRVAGGELDAAVHLAGGPWDHAVGVVIVEEAGGRFADLWGGRRVDTGTALLANPMLLGELLELAATFRPPEPDPLCKATG
jgi:histidinol-phosphatase